MNENKSRWVALAEIYVSMLAAALAMQSIPPLMSLLIQEFHLTHHQGGMLMSLFALPAIFVSLPAGMLADRYGIRRVGITGLALTLAGSALLAVAGSFVMLAIGRVVAGMGSIIIVVVSGQAIAQWFIGKEMGIAMGIFNTATPVGAIVSLNVLSALASRWGWRPGIWGTVGFAALALAVYSLFFRSPEHTVVTKGKTGKPVDGKERDGSAIWLVALCWALFTSSIMSLFSFAPDFMVSEGFTLQTAGFGTSLVMGGSLFLSPIIGYAVDRYGRQEALVIAGGLATAVLLLLVPGHPGHFVILMVIIGVAAALVPAPLYSVAAQAVSHRRLGRGFGLMATLNNVGVFVGPQLVGLSRDVTGSYRAGFWLMALLAALVSMTAVALRMTRRRGGR